LNNSKRKAIGRAKQEESVTRTRKTRITIFFSVFIVVIVMIVSGIAIYRNWVAPFKTIVIDVNDNQISMRYFLKRVSLSGEEPMNMLNILTKEQMIMQSAEKSPFNIIITEDDMDKFARNIASGENKTIDEDEFKEWYRQQLNMTRLSDSEYKDLLRIGLLSMKMEEYLTKFIPTVAEQVFVNMISVIDYSKMETIKKKYEAGEDFASLALEYSIDPDMGMKGGKLGWFPRGALDSMVDEVVFTLDVGSLSDPISLGEEMFVVLMVSEKTQAREINEQSMEILKSGVLDEWLKNEYANQEVKYYGFNGGGYDSETDAWVKWQVWRMQQGQEE